MIKDIPTKDANVCFVHVEKAGGTTLHDFFLQHLPRYWVMPPQQKGYGWRYSADYLRKLRRILLFSSIGGHQLSPFDNYATLFDNPLYVSFVRDPVDRYLSHVNWRSRGKVEDLDLFLSNDRTLNAQCMRICGQRKFQPAKQIIESSPYFIGVTESYDESLFILQRILGLRDVPYQASNVTKPQERRLASNELDGMTYNRIRDANSEDAMLYDWIVSEVFPRQKACFDWTDEEFEVFRSSTSGFRRGPGFRVAKTIRSVACRAAIRLAGSDSSAP